MSRSSEVEVTGEAMVERASELLRGDPELREALWDLHLKEPRLAGQMAALVLRAKADRDSRRAALDLMDDAVTARRVGQRENERRRRVEDELRDVNRHKDALLAALRERERALESVAARQQFFLTLSDRMRGIVDAEQILSAATQALQEHFGASRVVHVPLAEVGPDVTLGGDHLAWRSDVTADPATSAEAKARYAALGVRAWAHAPLVKDGRTVGVLAVQFPTPHAWSSDDLALLRETAERTWAAVERARSAEALRESEERYRTLFESMDEGFALCEIVRDAAGRPTDARCVELNRALEAQLGRTRARATGRSMRDVISGFDDRWLATCSRVVDQGMSVRFDYDRPDVERWYDVRAFPQGRDRFAVLFEDVTERKLADVAKDEFLATLSHELRTPVAAILLWAGALRSGGISASEVGPAVDAIRQSAEAQSRLVEDLLDLSRLKSGKLHLAPTPVFVESALRSAFDIVRKAAEEKRIALTIAIENDLGPALLDAARLKQIVWNLLSNSTKFTPAGGSLSLRARKTLDGDLELEVADTGEGIAPDLMPHLFERFRQGDMGETRRHAGLGIGLALTRQLVEIQGGSVRAESEGRGRGSVFHVKLPLVVPESNACSETQPETSRSREAVPLRDVRVLLVEDDANTREAMRCTLVAAGAYVVAVGSAAEALEALARSAEPAPVIVSDLGLPGMSGYDFIERVVRAYRGRALPPPPACAISAHAREVDRQRAIEAGFDLYVAKPVTPERLIEALIDLRDIGGSPHA